MLFMAEPKCLRQGLAHTTCSVTGANVCALTPGQLWPEQKQNTSVGNDLPFTAEESTAGWLGVGDRSDTSLVPACWLPAQTRPGEGWQTALCKLLNGGQPWRSPSTRPPRAHKPHL